MTSPSSTPEGTGPLHEHGPAGEAAANEEAYVAGQEDQQATDEHPTGEPQAEENRKIDPPS